MGDDEGEMEEMGLEDDVMDMAGGGVSRGGFGGELRWRWSLSSVVVFE
jgi:hypothetical protein